VRAAHAATQVHHTDRRRSDVAAGRARAQQVATPVIGFLNATSLQGYGRFLPPFHKGLGEAGFTEGRNVRIEYRWAEGNYDLLTAMAADLVRRRVDVIAATSTPANVVAKAATTTIPIVFTTSSDPVKIGLVASLSHPGGNVTGAVTLNVEVAPKRLELLNSMVPAAGMIGALINPERASAADDQLRALRRAADALGQDIRVFRAESESEIEAAFAQLAEQRAKALFVTTDAFFFSQRSRLIGLANHHAIPTIFDRREFVEAGGLMSYGGSVTDIYRLAGGYVGRILKGEKTADLPVQLSTKVEFILNLKTAKALGITVPVTLLASADEVIE
jgi:putative tryptophan/tyrosine transport system substrate-binding protein